MNIYRGRCNYKKRQCCTCGGEYWEVDLDFIGAWKEVPQCYCCNEGLFKIGYHRPRSRYKEHQHV